MKPVELPPKPDAMNAIDAEKQQEAIKKIMQDKKVPFEQAVDDYIKRTK